MELNLVQTVRRQAFLISVIVCLKNKITERKIYSKPASSIPVLTVIQVFMNPDIYLVDHFWMTKARLFPQRMYEKVQDCITENLARNKDIQWKMYRLLTAGDFAVVVRSSRIHDAYDISTLIRRICFQPNQHVGKKGTPHFYIQYFRCSDKNSGKRDCV